MKAFVHEINNKTGIAELPKNYDVVVVGGGVSGICAALASARTGATTALIQDRSVLGGNASSECRMHISGASCHWGKKDAAETGIIHELMLENKYLNDNFNYTLWDAVLWDAVSCEDGLDVYLNTTMYRVDCDNGEIRGLHCYRMSTEEHFLITAKIYLDCTGHGTLGAFSGAEYRIGCEAKDEFGEPDAPDTRNGNTMGNTIYFCAHDTGHPVKFVKPRWAYSFDENDFVNRPHGDVIVYHDADRVVTLPRDFDYKDSKELVEKYDVQSGYWWIEIGGDWDDIIKQSEDIRDELLKIVYGVWDHIKNYGGEHGAENYELIWVGAVPGIRESRRLMGDYILSQKDIYGNTYHKDSVAYGGWPMDEHTPGGFNAKGMIPSRVISFEGLYGIPYGCFCSVNIKNLMMAGRNLSATKLGLSSTRVMGTCAIEGQAVGTAAAMAAKQGLIPHEFGKEHIEELRQRLLADDCFIPGCENSDKNDLARTAKVTATSEKTGFEAANVISGVARPFEGKSNMWSSDGIGADGETIALKLGGKRTVRQVRLTFDSNLNEEICISVSKAFIDKERCGAPCELVRDYTVEAYLGGEKVMTQSFSGNHHRHVVHDFMPTEADEIKVTVTATNGNPDVHIFEIRVY